MSAEFCTLAFDCNDDDDEAIEEGIVVVDDDDDDFGHFVFSGGEIKPDRAVEGVQCWPGGEGE